MYVDDTFRSFWECSLAIIKKINCFKLNWMRNPEFNFECKKKIVTYNVGMYIVETFKLHHIHYTVNYSNIIW